MDLVSLHLHADPLIELALREDMNGEDLSTRCVIRDRVQGSVDLIAKETGVLCGLSVFSRVFELLDPTFHMECKHGMSSEDDADASRAQNATRSLQDGDEVQAGEKIAVLHGDLGALLSGERTALNLLQRLSGIATYARQMSALLEGTGIRLVDTRKTTPGLRFFEKMAVRVGGASNHRYNLTDGIMLKDNHVNAAGGIRRAVAMAKEYAPFVHKIEVEVETPQGAEEAASAGANIIMLDNMSHDEMKQAIERIAGRAEIEVSGNVTPERIESLKDLKVDYISSGALTYAAPILDLSMKNMRRV